MGIQGLLPLIQPAIETRHISYFRGKRLAIDGYAWLHKGMYSCCEDLAMGKENYSWIKYCLKYVDMLLSFQVCLTMVFDGSNLPQKMATEKTRKEKRRLSLEKGLQLKQDGDHGGARNHFTTSVDVTPFMAAQLIDVLKRHRPKVDCIVAPYEADAQLAYLTLNGFVDAVVSEDSDTIPFGCSEVIFKLDLQGNCQHLVHKDLFTKTLDSKFDLSTFTQSMLTTMCIASGCDYLDSCRGMGLKNALKHVLKNRSVVPLLRALRLQGIIPLVSAIPKAPLLNSSTSTSSSSADMDNMMHTSHPLCFIVADGKLAPATSLQQYELLFYKAYLTFQHQTVYDPKSCKFVHLHPLPSMSELEHLVTSDVLRQIELYNPLLIEFNINPKFCFVQVDSLVLYLDTSFLGPLSADGNDGSARGISRGELDPVTRQPFLPLESLEILPNGDLRRQISSGQTQAVSQSSTNSRQQSTSSSSVVYSSNSNSNSSYGKTSFVTTGVVFKASTHAHTHVPSYASIPSSSSSSTVPSAPPTTMFASLPSVAQSPRRSPRKRSSDSIQSYTLTARREDAVTTAETAIDISQEMEGSCTTTLRTNLQVFAPKDDRPILQSTSIRASSTSSSSRLSGGGNNNTSVSNSSKKLTQFFSTSNSKMPMPKSSSLALPVTASSVKTAQSKLPKVSGKSLISSHKASTSSATFPLSKKQKLSQSEYKKFLTLSGPDGSDGGKNTRAISSNERTSSLSISLTDSDDEVYNKRRVNSDVIDITDSPAVVSRKEKKTPRTAQSDGSGGTGSSGDQVSTGISPRPYEHSLSPPTGKDATKKLFERFGIC